MRRSTGESGADLDLSQIEELERRLANFRIDVDADVTVRGSAYQGYAFHFPTCEESGFGGGGGPPIPGACCFDDGHCEILTTGECIASGGTPTGGTCDPNPCPQPTGACCVGTDCTIETEDDCTGMGGVYQGDDTDCDPNPCEMVDCSCGFDACDGSGRRFLTRVQTTHIVKIQSCLNSDPTLTCEAGIDGTQVITDTYDPSDCSIMTDIVRSGDWTVIGGFETLIFHNCNGSTGHTDPISCAPACISATEEFCSSETDFHHLTCTPVDTSLIVTIDIVYSDECNPI